MLARVVGGWRTMIAAAVVLLIVIQAVPYGRNRTNPPVQSEPAWDSPETRNLAQRACFDCHSNETLWPAYSRIAPVSWLIQHDIEEGRAALNFSEWQGPHKDAAEAPKAVAKGDMPPMQYRLIHPEARLGDADRQRLARGLEATLRGAHEHVER